MKRSLLEKSRTYLGESDIDTLTLEFSLAKLLNKNKKYIQAEELAIINNTKVQKSLGLKHLYALLSKDNIAVSLTGQKKYIKAEKLFNQLLYDIKQTMGTNNPYIILFKKHLVTLLHESNQIQSALLHLQELIDMQVQLFGEDHVDAIDFKQWYRELSELP